VWSQLRTFERASSLSGMPREVDLRLRSAQAGEVDDLF